MKRSHGQRIGYLNRMAHRYFNEKLGELGISPGQTFVLKSLYHHDGIHQEVLVQNCQIHKANVARAITKLEENGLVKRIPDPEDKRANLLFTTEKAKDIQSKFLDIFHAWTELLTKGFSEEEKELSYEFLSRMAMNVEPQYGDDQEELKVSESN